MRKIMVALALLLLVAGMALADTLTLRNGTVLQGTCIGYEGGQFIFETSNGEQTKYSSWQVSRLTMDRGTNSDENTRYRRLPRQDRDNLPSSSGAARWESIPAFDVRLQEQWIRSQVQVRRGQRVRVESTGTVQLEGRNVNPDGQSNSRNANLPMANQNDGALIAVIGRDEDAPPILIGHQREFVADRDGTLYFTVNHWETHNAGGAFRVTVSIDRSTGGRLGDLRGATQRREKAITVPGNTAWVDTGIELNNDVTLDITAEGQITFRRNQLVGPEGDIGYNSKDVRYPINSSGVGALIAKIRYSNGTESAPRFIGAHNTKTIGSSEYGRLFLGINDNAVNDNTGSYAVTIRW
jgi:hypothetical protein